uniref:Uncharacterized protein n=1 Tax=Manihot esculenta TaxID=3983 RepID=A0A199UA43_MANES
MAIRFCMLKDKIFKHWRVANMYYYILQFSVFLTFALMACSIIINHGLVAY